VDHTTATGRATAVAETVPAVAVTDSSRHREGSIQSHVPRPTTAVPDGFTLIAGDGSEIERSASRATALGSTGGGAAGGPVVIHTVWVFWTPVATSSQVTEYHAPGSGPPLANPPSLLSAR
jgi:hypothetical protein